MKLTNGSGKAIKGLCPLGRAFQADELETYGRAAVVRRFAMFGHRVEYDWRFTGAGRECATIRGTQLDGTHVGNTDAHPTGGQVLELCVSDTPRFHAGLPVRAFNPKANGDNLPVRRPGALERPSAQLLNPLRPMENCDGTAGTVLNGFQHCCEHALLVVGSKRDSDLRTGLWQGRIGLLPRDDTLDQ